MPDLDDMLSRFALTLRAAGQPGDAAHVEAVAAQLRDTLAGRSTDLYEALETLHDCAESALIVARRHTRYLPPRREEPLQ